jgi:hypothetical protein
MVTPSYLRLFAVTDTSPAGSLALEYTKSLLRIAPVRAIPVHGAGIWAGYESLLTTPLEGSFINVVAALPGHWHRTLSMEVPAKADPVVADRLSSSWEIDHGHVTEVERAKPEVLTKVIELHTPYDKGEPVRNILFPAGLPSNSDQLASAKKYDAVVVSNEVIASTWRRHGIVPSVIPLPVADLVTHDRLFSIVTGTYPRGHGR